ncbi:hypothetical protein AA0119_g2828 [Alternaria tenuissima]|uniref:Uncharacterized protein n=1 Tax=Alternaria tenuissima TaxID=119927 RepID=A0AB37WND7_9PLEO|nr:hypothetical protein AA0115_g3562 [Alternaria tenuissima]RYO06144.1 hypothetical protein AA0119_g2828 [Alternaria tenuissima]RYO17954.1 hypothetical protein AA0121_g5370 [Alternaria tenuissima]
MPGHLRTRLKRVLTAGSHKNAKPEEPESDFYKPGEKMPPLKYRRAVDPEHKKKLEEFSFSTAWRRHSNASLYSPMGSRLPSRRSSFRRRSRSRSMHRSRRGSCSSDYDAEEWVDSGIGASIAGDDRPANIKEASDDEGDVLNVGLSRNPTEDPRDARRQAARRSSSVQLTSRPATGSDRTGNPSQPFSAEELEIALQKSHLEATKEESDKSANESPFEDFDDPSPFLRPRGGSIYVPYNGQGTPPKLPFWGTAYPSCDDAPSAGHFSRRPSVFLASEDGCCTPQYDRRESFFVPMDAPGLTQARRTSVFVPADDECVCPPPAAEAPKRKPQPCAPCDAIAAILARPD